VTPERHRRRRRALASLGVLAAMLAAAAWFVHRHWAEFSGLRIVEPRALLPLAALLPLVIATNGLQLRYLVRPFGVRLTALEWYGLAAITTFYNTLTPFRGGMLAKAAYLHRCHRLGLSGFLSVTAGTSIVNLCVAGLLGLAGLGASLWRGGAGSAPLAAMFGGATLATAAVMAFSPRFPDTAHPLLARVGRILNGWYLIRSDLGLLALIWLATVVQYLLAAAGTKLSFMLIGVPVPAEGALVLAAITSFAGLIGVTPAGLGIVEAVAVFAGLALGLTPAQSLAAAVARRIVVTAGVLVLGPPFTFTLLRGADRGHASAQIPLPPSADSR
jgi:uncharacterized membrane protein YbhN (UPF0104 family)